MSIDLGCPDMLRTISGWTEQEMTLKVAFKRQMTRIHTSQNG